MSHSRSTPHSTPIRRSSDKHPDSSSRFQSDLKQELKLELCDAVYQSDTILDLIYQDVPRIEEVVATFNSKKMPDFPPPGTKEKQFYDPFVKTLNLIKDCMMELNLMANSIYRETRFEKYDKEMKEGSGSDDPIKPDLILRRPGVSGGSASWREIELVGEVKADLSPLMLQAATYARCILAFQRGRRFVPIIFFCQTKMEVSFGIFTPSWFCFTKSPHNLNTSKGRNDLVRSMARIYYCNDRWRAGFDPSCNNRHCVIPSYGRYAFAESLCFRSCVRGRRTRVDIVKKVEDSEVAGRKTDEPKANELKRKGKGPASAEPELRYNLRSLAKASRYPDSYQDSTKPVSHRSGTARVKQLKKMSGSQSKKETPDSIPSPTSVQTPGSIRSPGSVGSPQTYKTRQDPWNCGVVTGGPKVFPADTDLEYTVTQSNSNLPEFLVVKDSWPLSDRATEGKMFKEVEGQFGVPDVLGSYQVKNSEASEEDATATLFPEDAVKWGGWGVVHEKPEHRIHMRIIIRTQGRSLMEAKGPKELLLGVLHAMIGHWNLLKAGWLHRDVSIGNVLLMREPESRLPLDGFDFSIEEKKRFQTCFGFITDGDLAIPWEDKERIVGTRRSGTPPFMSIALLQTLLDHDVHYVQTAIDDLESFVWVLFWAFLGPLKKKAPEGHLKASELSYYSVLHSATLEQLARKGNFLLDMKRKHYSYRGDQPEASVSIGFRMLSPLLMEWLQVAEEASLAMAGCEYKPEDLPGGALKFYQNHYERFLRIGLSYVDGLAEDWNYMQPNQVPT